MTRPNTHRSHAATSNQDDIKGIFAANLKAARLKAGLTQAQLAERTGLLQQYISLVEAGKHNITFDTLMILAGGVHRDVIRMLTPPRKPISRRT